jgi:phenol 2-monooxygenase (NADPH)
MGSEDTWDRYGWRTDWCAHHPIRSPCAGSSDQPKDFLWGVIDITPSEMTDFPDTRNKSAIHSTNGSCMIIPREGDKIRVYIQLSDTDAVDPKTGRINLVRYGPGRLLEVANKIVRPYTIDAAADKIEWWTIYQSNTHPCLRPRHLQRHSDHFCL